MADPGSGITVTTGGSGEVVVVTEAIAAEVRRLATVAHELSLQGGVLRGLLDGLQLAGRAGGLLPPGLGQARNSMDAAFELVMLAERRARDLHDALHRCLVLYEATENTVRAAWHEFGEVEAWSLGMTTRVFGIPVLIDVAGAVLISSALLGTTPAGEAAWLGDELQAHPQSVTNPAFVAELRESLSNSDEFGAGLLGVPLPVAQALGPDGAGLTSLPASAGVIAALGGIFGVLRESGVTVRRTSSSVTAGTASPGATSLVARADRIPSAAPGDPQIRIDRYSQPGKPDRFDVYIGGTVTFDPIAKTEPFDLTSDVRGVAQQSPAAYRAVAAAMKDAGVTSSTPVVVTGYSEGGLVASLVASSGHYDVKGLVTFGAPSGQVPIPAPIPVLTVRHTNDLVPATGGYDVNSHAVVVARDPFAGEKIPTDLPVPAHQLKYYEQTSALADASQDALLRSTLSHLDGFAAGATGVQSTTWLAARVPAAGAGDSQPKGGVP